jgi:hypothetical protein
MLPRRQFVKTLAAASMFGTGQFATAAELPGSETRVPTRTVTRGPKFHWFGYYDKFEFDATHRYLLSNQVEFEHRSPTAEDTIRVGMVDLQDQDRWIELGTSRAWGWQQGCMLQWIPSAPPASNKSQQVLWNDREGEQFVARVYDLASKQTRTLPRPIYTISPDGTWGLSLDFARLNNLRPGYGYAGVADKNIDLHAPDDVGIWRVDLATGESKLLLSIAQIAAIAHKNGSVAKYWNWFNHLLINPTGTRFIFLHRWREQYNPHTREGSNFITRMFTAAADGSDPYIVDPSGATSHFVWRDAEHICAWTRPAGKKDGFYLLRDHTQEVEQVGENVMTVNGHNTYVPNTNNEWILNDTYPQGPQRLQTPYLYHVPSRRRFDLGHFHSPPSYAGEWRCDTHPRSSRDGRFVAIDSPHTGSGRQLHLLDVSGIVK